MSSTTVRVKRSREEFLKAREDLSRKKFKQANQECLWGGPPRCNREHPCEHCAKAIYGRFEAVAVKDPNDGSKVKVEIIEAKQQPAVVAKKSGRLFYFGEDTYFVEDSADKVMIKTSGGIKFTLYPQKPLKDYTIDELIPVGEHASVGKLDKWLTGLKRFYGIDEYYDPSVHSSTNDEPDSITLAYAIPVAKAKRNDTRSTYDKFYDEQRKRKAAQLALEKESRNGYSLYKVLYYDKVSKVIDAKVKSERHGMTDDQINDQIRSGKLLGREVQIKKSIKLKWNQMKPEMRDVYHDLQDLISNRDVSMAMALETFNNESSNDASDDDINKAMRELKERRAVPSPPVKAVKKSEAPAKSDFTKYKSIGYTVKGTPYVINNTNKKEVIGTIDGKGKYTAIEKVVVSGKMEKDVKERGLKLLKPKA